MNGEEESEEVLWVAKVFLLFGLDPQGSEQAQELASVQYMDVTDPISGVDKGLGCVCLRLYTEDETDRTIEISRSLRDNHLDAGEYYGLVPFSSIIGSVQVLRSNIAIRPFTSPLTWPLHRFYINRFYNANEVKQSADVDSVSDLQ